MVKNIQPFLLKDQQAVIENLSDLQEQSKETHLNQLFAADPLRFQKFSVEYDQLVLDFSKHRINQQN